MWAAVLILHTKYGAKGKNLWRQSDTQKPNSLHQEQSEEVISLV
jgi:hypothetical protein